MATTDGWTRNGNQHHAGDRRSDGDRRARTGRRLAVGLAGLALGVSGVAACTGGSPAPAGTVTVTSTTAASGPPAGSPPPTSSSPPVGGAPPTTTPATSANGGAEVPTTQAAGGLAPCTSGQMRVTVMSAPGGGSAGHQEMQVIATNTGPTQCSLKGYPGVSLTAPGSGAQLGAAADRVPGDSPQMRLEPGRTAVASLLVAQSGVYGSSCAETAAAGFRIYLPGQTAAIFAPFPTSACRTASVHQLSIKPFTA